MVRCKIESLRVATVEKLGGWDDESAGKIVEKTNHRVGATRGGNEAT